MSWQAVLEQADVLLRPISSQLVELRTPDGRRQVLQIRRVRFPLQLAGTRRLLADAHGLGQPFLVVAPHASSRAARAIADAGASLVTDDGDLQLAGAFDTQQTDLLGPALRAPIGLRPTQRGPLPWGLMTVARRLLHLEPARQLALANVSGVSQKTVSVALKHLRELDLVAMTRAGASPLDRAMLLQWWLASYPRGEEIAAHYISDAPLASQLKQVAARLPSQRIAVSGSFSADQLSPWAGAGRVRIYCSHPEDLEPAGFLPAPLGLATLSVVVSPDPGLWMPRSPDADTWFPAADLPAGTEMADPSQVLLDLGHDGGIDSDQAAQRLTDWMLNGPGNHLLRDHLQECAKGPE